MGSEVRGSNDDCYDASMIQQGLHRVHEQSSDDGISRRLSNSATLLFRQLRGKGHMLESINLKTQTLSDLLFKMSNTVKCGGGVPSLT